MSSLNALAVAMNEQFKAILILSWIITYSTTVFCCRYTFIQVHCPLTAGWAEFEAWSILKKLYDDTFHSCRFLLFTIQIGNVPNALKITQI